VRWGREQCRVARRANRRQADRQAGRQALATASAEQMGSTVPVPGHLSSPPAMRPSSSTTAGHARGPTWPTRPPGPAAAHAQRCCSAAAGSACARLGRTVKVRDRSPGRQRMPAAGLAFPAAPPAAFVDAMAQSHQLPLHTEMCGWGRLRVVSQRTSAAMSSRLPISHLGRGPTGH